MHPGGFKSHRCWNYYNCFSWSCSRNWKDIQLCSHGSHWLVYSYDGLSDLIRILRFATVSSLPPKASSILCRSQLVKTPDTDQGNPQTIPHIEVGMGSGVFTSHRSAQLRVLWTLRPPATSGSKHLEGNFHREG
ncbi:hypothetical protein Tco_1552999, partial [Tanacetum coccineum]